ncbi:hypothetical protein CP973_21985 [Streptomyces albofaciens JCM 4342]|uniref:hypothetical protein n=1 Tax=Streptomyces albofaciens TaxID=66866 RepID=UPI000B0E18F6|nr:hypothetical protein [Streptomyces albofaciens]KAA6212135.1 hypothetical protein CP973_21985 [Streptomyces albofaciens JCM 4342]
MPYGITFFRRLPGRTLSETLDHRAAAWEGWDGDAEAEREPMNLTPGRRADWEEIVRRVGTEIGPVSVEEYPHNLTLERNGPFGRIQLDYDGESADIEFAHHHVGEAARQIVAEAYRLAAMVEDITGLEGFDCETELPTAEGHVEAAVARLGTVSHWARTEIPRMLAKDRPSTAP